jgi:hypothetical protein
VGARKDTDFGIAESAATSPRNDDQKVLHQECLRALNFVGYLGRSLEVSERDEDTLEWIWTDAQFVDWRTSGKSSFLWYVSSVTSYALLWAVK